MILTLKQDINKEQVERLEGFFAKFDCKTSIVYGEVFSTMSVLGDTSKVDENNIIRDADGKEIGRVFGADSENPQVYIKEPAPFLGYKN